MSEILAPKPINRAVSHLASLVSWASVEVPVVGDLIIGGDDRVQRVRYRVADLLSKDISLWADFKGNPKATRLPIPRLYTAGNESKKERLVGVTRVNREVFADSLLVSGAAVPAVAWRLGNAVLATEITLEDLNAIAVDGYGMRIGHDDLHTTVGWLFSGGNDKGLIIPSGAVTARDVVGIKNLSPDVRIY